MRLTHITFLFSLLAFTSTHAQQNASVEEIVVSAPRIEEPASAERPFTLTEEDFEHRNSRNVFDSLKDSPELTTIQAGPRGGQSSVLIRGAKSEHTLVVLDGAIVNDPMNPGRTFDFSSLPLDQIESIRVLKGPHASIYGSDAVGGVIEIKTKKGKGKPKGYVSVEAGTDFTFQERGGVSGRSEKLSYSLAGSRVDSDGFSAASEKDGNTESDGFRSTAFSALFGYDIHPQLDVASSFRYLESESDLDNFGGPGGDDPNYVLTQRNYLFRNEINARPFSAWKASASWARSFQVKEDQNPTDGDHPDSSSDSRFESTLDRFEFQNEIQVSDSAKFSVGADAVNEEGKLNDTRTFSGTTFETEAKGKLSRVAPKARAEFRPVDFLAVDASSRLEFPEKFQTQTAHRLAARASAESGTHFLASAGTAFKTPTIYQLYSNFGNQDLLVERSIGWDAGLEQEFSKSSLAVTYFDNRVRELIDFRTGPNGRFENLSSARTYGVEVSGMVEPVWRLKVLSGYTYLLARDGSGKELLRRPKHKARMNVEVDVTPEVLFFGLGTTFVGVRPDRTLTKDVTLRSYTRFDLNSRWKVSRQVQMFSRVENLSNVDYEEIAGYGTAGITGSLGVRMVF